MSDEIPIKFDKDGQKKERHEFKFKWDKAYDNEMPNRFIESMKRGESIPEFLLSESMSRKSFDRYCLSYPEMGEAREIGKKFAEAWWMQQAKKHLVIHNTTEKEGDISISTTTKFDTNLYRFYMGGRFGHTGDKKVQDLVNLLEEFMLTHIPKPPQYTEHAECEAETNDNKTE